MEAVQEDHCSCLLRGMSPQSGVLVALTIIVVQKNNKLVWDETVLIMKDLFDNVWGTQDTIAVKHVIDITLPVRYHTHSNPQWSLLTHLQFFHT